MELTSVHLDVDMARDLYERLCQALDLLNTPMALEVLERLVNERPYSHLADSATIGRAVECLDSIGAVCTCTGLANRGAPLVVPTPRGRYLLGRLIRLQEMLRREDQQDRH
jgi:hypothetical protein